jgi:hypothetical protein
MMHKFTKVDFKEYKYDICRNKIWNMTCKDATEKKKRHFKQSLYCYITYGVVFIQFHWLNQSVIYRIFNVFFPLCEETRPLVSIFTYIDAMLLNLEVPVPQQTKRKFVNL